MNKRTYCLLFIIAYTFLVAVCGGYFVNTASPAYTALNMPSFTPPPAVFIGAWTLIYIFTAAGAYISCKNGEKGLLYVYALNGAVNALWTYVFFYKNNIIAALFLIFVLAVTVIFIIRNSSDKRSKLLLVPYLFWLCIAAVLNYAIIVLN